MTLHPVPARICEDGTTSFRANGTGYISLQWQVFSGGVWTNLADDATYIGTNTQQLSIINAPVTMNGNQYRLALIAGCASINTNPATLTVNANPVVDFSAVDPILACGGVPVVINGNPTGGSGTFTQHRWTGDVGPLNSYTVQSPTFNSLITGDYNLNYRVTDSNSCTSSDDVTVRVDSPTAQFTQDADYGCTPLPVSFTKDMTGITKWWWDFGDGTPIDSLNANPVHTFINTMSGSIEYFHVNLRVQISRRMFCRFHFDNYSLSGSGCNLHAKCRCDLQRQFDNLHGIVGSHKVLLGVWRRSIGICNQCFESSVFQQYSQSGGSYSHFNNNIIL